MGEVKATVIPTGNGNTLGCDPHHHHHHQRGGWRMVLEDSRNDTQDLCFEECSIGTPMILTLKLTSLWSWISKESGQEGEVNQQFLLTIIKTAFVFKKKKLIY